jgi:hypothetical protein
LPGITKTKTLPYGLLNTHSFSGTPRHYYGLEQLAKLLLSPSHVCSWVAKSVVSDEGLPQPSASTEAESRPPKHYARVSETWPHKNSTELLEPSFEQLETVEDVHLVVVRFDTVSGPENHRRLGTSSFAIMHHEKSFASPSYLLIRLYAEHAGKGGRVHLMTIRAMAGEA